MNGVSEWWTGAGYTRGQASHLLSRTPLSPPLLLPWKWFGSKSRSQGNTLLFMSFVWLMEEACWQNKSGV